MKKTKDLIASIPFISFTQFLIICKIPQYTFVKYVEEEVTLNLLAPEFLIKALIKGSQLTHDIILEALTNPKATRLIVKYLKPDVFTPEIIENIEKYLNILDELELHLKQRLSESKFTTRKLENTPHPNSTASRQKVLQSALDDLPPTSPPPLEINPKPQNTPSELETKADRGILPLEATSPKAAPIKIRSLGDRITNFLRGNT